MADTIQEFPSTSQIDEFPSDIENPDRRKINPYTSTTAGATIPHFGYPTIDLGDVKEAVGGGVSDLSVPLVEIPKFTAKPDDSATASVAKAAANQLTGMAGFFLSPLGIATVGMGSAPVAVQKLIAAGYALDMGSKLPDEVRDANAKTQRYLAGDKNVNLQDLLEAHFGTALNVALTGKIGEHALSKAEAPTAPIPEFPSAAPQAPALPPESSVPPVLEAVRSQADVERAQAQIDRQREQAGQLTPRPQQVIGRPPEGPLEYSVSDTGVAGDAQQRLAEQNANLQQSLTLPAPVGAAPPVLTQPKVPNAQGIRNDQGQPAPTGQVPQGSQVGGSPNLQQPPPEQPQPVVAGEETPPPAPRLRPNRARRAELAAEIAAPSPEAPQRYTLAGAGPQTHTIDEVLPQTPLEVQQGEQPVRIVNERTKEAQIVDRAQLRPVGDPSQKRIRPSPTSTPNSAARVTTRPG